MDESRHSYVGQQIVWDAAQDSLAVTVSTSLGSVGDVVYNFAPPIQIHYVDSGNITVDCIAINPRVGVFNWDTGFNLYNEIGCIARQSDHESNLRFVCNTPDSLSFGDSLRGILTGSQDQNNNILKWRFGSLEFNYNKLNVEYLNEVITHIFHTLTTLSEILLNLIEIGDLTTANILIKEFKHLRSFLEYSAFPLLSYQERILPPHSTFTKPFSPIFSKDSFELQDANLWMKYEEELNVKWLGHDRMKNE